MKKILAIVMASMFACAAFAGCGAKQESKEETTTAPETTAAVATTAAPVATPDSAVAPSADAEKIVGTWVVGGFVMADGTAYNTAEYAEANGVEEAALLITYTFDKEGKSTCSVAGVEVEGTYTFDGKTIQTQFTGSAPKFEFDAEKDVLTVLDENTGVTTIMQRADAEANAAEAGAEDSEEAAE